MLYVYINLLWKTFSLGPDEARSNLPKFVSLNKISPVTEKTYLIHSSYFKDIFLYLSQNKLPSAREAIKKVEALSE